MRKLILMRAGDELALRAGLFGEAEAFVVDLQHTPAETAADLLKIASALGRRSLARIHPLASGRADSDLDAIMRWAPYGVILPQAGGGSDAQHLGAKLAVREAENGLDDGVTRIFASAADLPMAIFKLGSLAGATRRLAGLIWDAGALAEAWGWRRIRRCWSRRGRSWSMRRRRRAFPPIRGSPAPGTGRMRRATALSARSSRRTCPRDNQSSAARIFAACRSSAAASAIAPAWARSGTPSQRGITWKCRWNTVCPPAASLNW